MAANIKTIINSDPLTEMSGMSRDDLQVGDVVQCFSVDAAVDTGYSWSLSHVPEGSDSELVVEDNYCEFTVDVVGPYLIHLTVDPGTSFEDNQYLRLRSLTSFGSLRLVAAGEQLGDLAIPSDLTGTGWAKDQNFNLSSLGSELAAISASGRILFVDSNSGADGHSILAGYGNFDNIQEAIECAKEHITSPASESNQWMIVVQAGLYQEDIKVSAGINLVANGQVTLVNTGPNDVHWFQGGSAKGFVFHSDSEEADYPVVYIEPSYEVILEGCEINRESVGATQGPCLLVEGVSGGSQAILKRCEITNHSAGIDTHAIGVKRGGEVMLSECHVQGAEGMVVFDGTSDAEITRTIIEANNGAAPALRSAGTLDVSHSELLGETLGLVVTPIAGHSDEGGGQTLVRFTKISLDYSYDFSIDVPELKMVGVELDSRTEIHGDALIDGSVQLISKEDQPDEDSDPKLWADDDGRLRVDGEMVAYDTDLEPLQEEIDGLDSTATDIINTIATLNAKITELESEIASVGTGSKLTHLHREVVEGSEYTCHSCDEYLGVQTESGLETVIYLEENPGNGRRVIICDETGLGTIMIRPLSTTTTPSLINGERELEISDRESVTLICGDLKDDGSVAWAIN